MELYSNRGCEIESEERGAFGGSRIAVGLVRLVLRYNITDSQADGVI